MSIGLVYISLLQSPREAPVVSLGMLSCETWARVAPQDAFQPAVQSRRRKRCIARARIGGAVEAGVRSVEAGVSTSEPSAPRIEGSKRVVLLGGSGRVGASTGASLAAAGGAQLQLSIAGRSESSYQVALQQWPQLAGASFQQCNIDNPASIRVAIRGADLVIHSAGPFQRRPDCSVLEAAIAEGVPYLDVCDDLEYSQRAKSLHSKAQVGLCQARHGGGLRRHGRCRHLPWRRRLRGAQAARGWSDVMNS